ncbi:hypothetical protein FUSO7_12545 [Fusobacterium necrophorum BFTR-2]|nr:transketolase [Fusobacterium necrophorum]KDE68850.1 hypothetical protein FUSO7_12545 [Fusobacterium necrophorum BFTR-2]
MKIEKIRDLKKFALEIRKNLLQMCCRIEGPLHIGGDLSLVDILAVLYGEKINLNIKNIYSPYRDRFILSKGHCAAVLYITMALKGFFDIEEICNTYGKLNSRFGMHPCKLQLPELDTSSGSLGHGLSIAVGMALSSRIDNRDNRIYVIMGDGESQEGSNWEAAMSASKYKLGNIVLIIDKNNLQLDGKVCDIMPIEPFVDKWKAFGWNTLEIDGHDISALLDAFENIPAPDSLVPTVIICNTIKGKGISFMENRPEWHAGSIDEDVLKKCLKELQENFM